jgi:hypothetical protein
MPRSHEPVPPVTATFILFLSYPTVVIREGGDQGSLAQWVLP